MTTKKKRAAAAAVAAALAAASAAPAAYAATPNPFAAAANAKAAAKPSGRTAPAAAAKKTKSTRSTFSFMVTTGAAADGFDAQISTDRSFANAVTLRLRAKGKKTFETSTYMKLDGKKTKLTSETYSTTGGGGTAKSEATVAYADGKTASGEVSAKWAGDGIVGSAKARGNWTKKIFRATVSGSYAWRPDRAVYVRARATIDGKTGKWSAPATLFETGGDAAQKQDATAKKQAKGTTAKKTTDGKTAAAKKLTAYAGSKVAVDAPKGAKSWTTSNGNVVVTKGSDGKTRFRCRVAGRCVVKCAKDGKTTTWEVKILPLIDEKTIRIQAGKKYDFNLAGVADAKAKWRSADPSVATVDAKGAVTAKKPGQTKISATIGGSVQRVNVVVTKKAGSDAVKIEYKKKSNQKNARDIAISPASPAVAVGTTLDLELTCLDDSSAEWTSSNPKVAKVGPKGVVKALAEGKATITARTNKSYVKTVVTVSKTFATPDSWIKEKAGAFVTQKARTKRGAIEFGIFDQKNFTQWSDGSWSLSSNGCAVCATTTIIRAFGRKEYSDLTPGGTIDRLHGGVPFNFFVDGMSSSLTAAGVPHKRVTFDTPGEMVAQLKKGTPMLIGVKGNGTYFAHSSGHSIAILGLTESGKAIIADSYDSFFGRNVYAIDPDELFTVMCRDDLSRQEADVLVIDP